MITELLGYSQTYQWYTGQPLNLGKLEYAQFLKNPCIGFKQANDFLEKYDQIESWQAKFRFGGDLTDWKNPNYDGWKGGSNHCLRYSSDRVERLIFNISGQTRTQEQWEADIKCVLKIIKANYQNLKQLYLQPVIGGINNQSNIRSIINHPVILHAIEHVVEQSEWDILRIGAALTMEEAYFSDIIGHLTDDGAKKAKEFMFKFYDSNNEN